MIRIKEDDYKRKVVVSETWKFCCNTLSRQSSKYDATLYTGTIIEISSLLIKYNLRMYKNNTENIIGAAVTDRLKSESVVEGIEVKQIEEYIPNK